MTARAAVKVARDALPPDLLAKEPPNARKSRREFAFEGRYAPS
ncbi:MAG: hypothetical protein WDO74_05815 [Pseudomonadota bacterium]